MQKADAELALEALQGMAERRPRYAKRVGGLLETAVSRHMGECFQIGEADVRHW
ncbi:hypothetical protein D9M69_675470 [compost metagenome]